MLVAVTGGTGVLGSVAVAQLLRDGHRVRVLSRGGGSADADAEGLEWVAGSLEDPEALDALVDGCDAILHAAYAPIEAPPAGRSAAEHLIQSNVGGTIRLIERTPATTRAQLIYVSSLAVYGTESHREPAAQRVPIDEDYPVWPREFYGGHKAALERMVLAGSGMGMNTSAFRIGCVLGDYSDVTRNKLAPVVREALEFGTIRSQLGAYVITAADAASLLSAALGDEGVSGRVFNCFHRWLDFAELAPRLSELLERDVQVACDPAPEPDPPIRNGRICERFDGWGTEDQLDAILRATLEAVRR